MSEGGDTERRHHTAKIYGVVWGRTTSIEKPYYVIINKHQKVDLRSIVI